MVASLSVKAVPRTGVSVQGSHHVPDGDGISRARQTTPSAWSTPALDDPGLSQGEHDLLQILAWQTLALSKLSDGG